MIFGKKSGCLIVVEALFDAVTKLKNKSSGLDNITSEHLVHAGHFFYRFFGTWPFATVTFVDCIGPCD